MVGFCIFFFFLIKDRSKFEILVNALFKKWINACKIGHSHPSNLYNLNTMADSSTFVQSVKNSKHNSDVCFNSALA